MLTGKYWGSAEHRKIVAEEKKEVLHLVKTLTEQQMLEPNETRKIVIDDQYAYYKKLLEYKF